MCGIAGIVGLNEEEAYQKVAQMTEHMSHRGPDAQGLTASSDFCLGHRRLSIIDLDHRSNQPFNDPSNRYSLVFNGEIYNYKALRKELDNYSFRTSSDTEVLLASYLTWGKDCLQKLNGMFAFAIWDDQDKSLFIARDRLGIKPLYYSLEKGFVFSSELRPIIKSGLVNLNIDKASVAEFLTYQTVHAPNTIIEGIKQLESGHYATYKNLSFKVFRYWNPAKSIINQDQAVGLKNLRDRLTKSVEHRMISDVPIGAFLSGGIDSSAIVGLMSEVSGQRINTFSMGFEEKDYDESKYAKLISKKFNTEHQSVTLTANDLLAKVPDILSQMDSPSADGINSYIISEEAKKSGLTVVLSGLGGDEIFGGYPVFKRLPKIQKNPVFQLSKALRTKLSPLASLFLEPHQRTRLNSLLRANSKNFEDLYPIFRTIASETEIASILNNHVTDRNLKVEHISQLGLSANISLAELGSYTANVLLRDVDQMSMANSLEVRVPFLDHTLVEMALACPESLKFNGAPKSLLVDALGDLLPDEIVNRRKQGFAFPWEQWLKHEMRDFTNEQLTKLKGFDVFKIDEIEHLWARFLEGDQKVHWSRIWTLAVLGSWLELNLN